MARINENNFNTEDFYDRLSENWDMTRPGYTQKIFGRMVSRLDKNNTHSILDFGCGTGLFCRFVSENFANAKIAGIDTSGRMIEKAGLNCPECKFYLGDILSAELPHFDAVFSKDVFNHIKNIDAIVSRLGSLLNAGGKLVIANREREKDVKNKIMGALRLPGFKTETEEYSFKPREAEINSFIKALPDFSERHREIVRKMLHDSGNYYIIFADKGN